MNLYVILRRNGWQSGQELQEAAERSSHVGDEEMPDEVRWIRSYVLEENAGSLGTVCIYQAVSPEAFANTRRSPISRWTRSSRSPTRSSCVPTRSRPSCRADDGPMRMCGGGGRAGGFQGSRLRGDSGVALTQLGCRPTT